MKVLVKFIHRNGLDHVYFDMIMENDLWYSHETHKDQTSVTLNNPMKRP